MIEKCKVCGCQFAVIWHEKTDRCSACERENYKQLKLFVRSIQDLKLSGDDILKKIDWDKVKELL